MIQHSPAILSRDVEVSAIPSGDKVTLSAGAEVVITQALGGSFTLAATAAPGLYRLEGRDADAIGQEVTENVAAPDEAQGLEEAIWAQLRTCYDPEIPVNIVDLGLIYTLDITPAEEGGSDVLVQMTLTAPGCGMGPVIASEARQKVLTVKGVSNAQVEVVWEPAWTPERISQAGKEKLGMV